MAQKRTKKAKKSAKKKVIEKRLTAKQRFEEKMKSKEIGELHLFRMDRLKRYCDDPTLSRKEQTKRNSSLEKLLDKKTGSLKPMYLYGSGSAYEWDKVMAHIEPTITQADLIDVMVGWPILKNNFDKISGPLKNILKGLKKLNAKELSLIEVIIEHTIKLNESTEK